MKRLQSLTAICLLLSLAPVKAANDQPTCTKGSSAHHVERPGPRRDPFRSLLNAVESVWMQLTSIRMEPLKGREEVLVSGRLRTSDPKAREVQLVAVANGERITEVMVADNGTFKVALPKETLVKLHFHTPGHVEKVVLVDTRHAATTARARRLNRKVRFDVVLVSEAHMDGYTYDGPVGSIYFVKGSGLMRVEHHEELVPLNAGR